MIFGAEWSTEEKSIVASKYGAIPKDELMKLLPNRTWRTIMERARKLGVNGNCHRGRNLYEINGDTTTIFLDMRNGSSMRCLISTGDLEKVVSFGKWAADFKKKTSSYYVRSKNIYLHRFLMGSPESKEIDHINFDTLDNRRENLRIATKSENMQNRNPANINSKSGVRNVYWNKSLNLWVAKVKKDGKTKTRYASTIEEAETIAADLRKSIFNL